MSGALILTLMLAAAAPASPSEEEEIQVIARALDKVSLNVSRDAKGRLQCSAIQSTGLPKLDGHLCEVTAKCVGKGSVDNAAVRACVAKRKPALLANVRALLRERRAQQAGAAQEAGA